MPFLVDLMPVHLNMIVDIMREQPDIIHTFQTFGATDISGFIAAHIMKARGRGVRLINTVMTEIDTYFGNYAKYIASCFVEQVEDNSLLQILKESARIGSSGEVNERDVFRKKMVANAVPILFGYAIVRASQFLCEKETFANITSRVFRRFLKAEIPAYLNRCDAVTVSRKEDVRRYALKTIVWEVPLACDLTKFRVYKPDVDEFIAKADAECRKGHLTKNGFEKLSKFLTDPDIGSKRPIIYVGRLSNEKNVSFLIDSYSKMLELDGMSDRIHFLFIGTGEKTEKINEIFGEDVSVTGLVPNNLLPDLYNFVRQRHGYFISASDTETYGISHEEAIACGVPLVAMQAGTRNHVFCPGDFVGESLLAENQELSAVFTASACNPSWSFIVGLNGIVVPDYTGERGLFVMPEGHESRVCTAETIFQAMYVMTNMPDSIMEIMSRYAEEFTCRSRFGWPLTWQLFSKGVYERNQQAHKEIYAPRVHTF
jgi:glycosyltransferase involved in cell wall biosynthesis